MEKETKDVFGHVSEETKDVFGHVSEETKDVFGHVSEETKYKVNQVVNWYTGSSFIAQIDYEDNGQIFYQLKHAEHALSCRISEKTLDEAQSSNLKPRTFRGHAPSLLVVDKFYKDPDKIRSIALEQTFHPNAKAYKGKRSSTRFLLPGVKEEFERLLGRPVRNWLVHGVNGCFQITNYTDPLVWHSDHQSYAAAIYLTPDAPVGAGTSFWKDKTHGCLRPPFHKLERDRFKDDQERTEAQDEIYSEYNLLHPDNWELVDRVGSVYNRLAIWDGQRIHSATSYTSFMPNETEAEAAGSRLVQLFFFDIED